MSELCELNLILTLQESHIGMENLKSQFHFFSEMYSLTQVLLKSKLRTKVEHEIQATKYVSSFTGLRQAVT